MKTAQYLCLAVASFCLAGCAPGTTAELKAKSDPPLTFDVPGNYQANYERIEAGARNCAASAFGAARIDVYADLLPDLKRGTISVGGQQDGTLYFLTSDITPNDKGGTHVSVWTYFKAWSWVGRRMPAWAAGDTDCRENKAPFVPSHVGSGQQS